MFRIEKLKPFFEAINIELTCIRKEICFVLLQWYISHLTTLIENKLL